MRPQTGHAAGEADIAELCRRFHVNRLGVFGSAARRSDFDPARSDVDLLVTYDPGTPRPTLEENFQFREQLEALFGRSVDLVMAGAVRNPYIRASRPSRGILGLDSSGSVLSKGDSSG
jgi:predicted nucleotidyltransferase